jgi:O-antigen ligase
MTAASVPAIYLWHRRIALACLSLMLVVPFLIAYHRLPIPSFYEEWWTALFGLGVMSLLVHRRHAFQLPSIALLPAILIICLALQIAIVAGSDANPAQLALLCLTWTLGLMLAARALCREIGAAALTRVVAWSLLGGALLAVVAAALQFSGLWSGLGLIMPNRGASLIGNVGQPNHLADQLWLGVAAAIYLRTRERLSSTLALASIGLLTATGVLTGSRSVWLYAIALIVLAILARRRQAAPERSLVHWYVAALVLQLAAQIVLPRLFDNAPLITGGERLYTDVGTSSVRLGLWTMAIRTWIGQPLLGAGWGSFPAQTYAFIGTLSASLPAGIQFHPGENAHNIVLAMLSELGLAAGLAVVIIPVLWLLRMARQPIDPEQSLCLALLLVIGIHSQLEYPLWYLNFLGVAALAGALADRAPWPRTPHRLAPAITVLMLLAGTAALGILRHDYQRLESALAWPRTPDGEAPRPWAEIQRELVEIRGRTLFSGYVDLALTGTMTIDRNGLADKITVAELARRFSPTDRVVFKHAALLALDGQAENARRAWLQALAAYPEAGPQVYQAASELSRQFPEIAPLRDLAAAYKKPGAT